MVGRRMSPLGWEDNCDFVLPLVKLWIPLKNSVDVAIHSHTQFTLILFTFDTYCRKPMVYLHK